VARRERYAALRPADIQKVDWAKAREISYMEGGSGGVVLVDLEDECVVLKPQGKTAANEMLAEHLALACGVRVAQCRILRGGEEEYMEVARIAERCRVVGMDATMGLILHFGRYRHHADNQWNDVSEKGGVEVFGVLEYVPGHALMGIEAQRVLASPADSLLLELGRLCALDVLLNNLDRVPLPIWQNDGNLGNVMVVGGGSSIAGIDQQVNLIVAGLARDAYLKKVRSLVLQVLPGGNPQSIIQNLQEALSLNCGASLSEEQARLILQGMLEGFRSIAEASESGALRSCLETGKQACYDRLHYDHARKWRNMLLRNEELLDMIEFVLAVGEAVTAAIGGVSS